MFPGHYGDSSLSLYTGGIVDYEYPAPIPRARYYVVDRQVADWTTQRADAGRPEMSLFIQQAFNAVLLCYSYASPI